MFAFDRLVFEIFYASDAQRHDVSTSQHGEKQGHTGHWVISR